jgi:hypothetical protein
MRNPELRQGLMAGFLATVAVSALLLLQGIAGFLPEMNFINLLNGALGTESLPIVGWLAHFAVGTALGGVFSYLAERMPGGAWETRGVLFAFAAWLVMMLLVSPMAGADVFGVAAGFWAPVWTLFLHIVYGAVLGAAFGRFVHHVPHMKKEPRHGAPAL